MVNIRQHLLLFAKVYLFGWLIAILGLGIGMLYFGNSWKEIGDNLLAIITWKNAQITLHVFILALYLFVITLRYFRRTYQQKGLKPMLKQLSIRLILPLFLTTCIVQCAIHRNTNENYQFSYDESAFNHSGQTKNLYKSDGKHRGMSVFNWGEKTDQYIETLKVDNIEWVALVPFYYQKTERTKKMREPEVVGEWDDDDCYYADVIKQLHAENMHVMMKPHLWMNEGWRSNITMDSAEEWDAWFDSYRNNILHTAMLAQEFDVELLCIGAEFRSSMKEQPDRWIALVQEIKSIYSGKLTYASNWDGEFDIVPFWDEMDYIGIQAYFPLTNQKSPSLVEIKSGWENHESMLKKLSKKHKKPILFTEIGYRSDETATIKPWVWGSALDVLTHKKSEETQNLAYEALFQKFWEEDWFAGIYIWQWHNRSKKGDKRSEMDFTPRYKAAENTISKWYGKED